MRTGMRRVRGAVGVGLTWGAAWFGAGMVLLAIVGLDAADVPFPLFFGLLGFLAGLAFAGLLRLVEGGHGFHQLSLPRFAGWGALGGVLLALGMAGLADIGGELPVLVPVFALAGAASAVGTLALARRGRERDRLGGAGDALSPGLPAGAPPAPRAVGVPLRTGPDHGEGRTGER